MKKCKVVLTYGTFDLLHIGHVNIFRRLKDKYEYLIVGVSTDEFNLSKGKKSIIPFEQRKMMVESVRYVDKVIAERSWDQKRIDVEKYEVDVFAIGDDWIGKFDFLKEICDVEYLPRTEDISSTKIRNTLTQLSKVNKQEIIGALEVLESLKSDLI